MCAVAPTLYCPSQAYPLPPSVVIRVFSLFSYGCSSVQKVFVIGHRYSPIPGKLVCFRNIAPHAAPGATPAPSTLLAQLPIVWPKNANCTLQTAWFPRHVKSMALLSFNSKNSTPTIIPSMNPLLLQCPHLYLFILTLPLGKLRWVPIKSYTR